MWYTTSHTQNKIKWAYLSEQFQLVRWCETVNEMRFKKSIYVHIPTYHSLTCCKFYRNEYASWVTVGHFSIP